MNSSIKSNSLDFEYPGWLRQRWTTYWHLFSTLILFPKWVLFPRATTAQPGDGGWHLLADPGAHVRICSRLFYAWVIRNCKCAFMSPDLCTGDPIQYIAAFQGSCRHTAWIRGVVGLCSRHLGDLIYVRAYVSIYVRTLSSIALDLRSGNRIST